MATVRSLPLRFRYARISVTSLYRTPVGHPRPRRVRDAHDSQGDDDHRVSRASARRGRSRREREDPDIDDPHHTFIFELDDGTVIDAGVRGNAARWINHSCAPNCHTYEDDDGPRLHRGAAHDPGRRGAHVRLPARYDGRVGPRVRARYALPLRRADVPGFDAGADAPALGRRWPGSVRCDRPGTLVVCEHTSKVLADNPLGDPHVRKLAVWLPPQYDEAAGAGRGRRFPVLYDLVGLHGLGARTRRLEALRRQRGRTRGAA